MTEWNVVGRRKGAEEEKPRFYEKLCDSGERCESFDCRKLARGDTRARVSII